MSKKKPSNTKKWQYKCYVGKALVNDDYPAMENDLIELGLDGWEFVQCYNANLFIFKKPLE